MDDDAISDLQNGKIHRLEVSDMRVYQHIKLDHLGITSYLPNVGRHGGVGGPNSSVICATLYD